MIFVLAFLLLGALAPPAGARELPVLVPGGAPVAGPAWRGDAVLVRLRPGPARLAAIGEPPPGTPGPAPRARLGVPALDAAAAGLGGARFEAMFRAGPRDAPRREAAGLAGFYRVRLAPGASIERALRVFGALPEVESVEPIAVVPVSFTPNDSLFPLSTWFAQPSGRDIHAPEAWSIWTGDTTAVIGILDTGVLPYHPDLGGTVAGLAGHLFVNWAERGGVPGVDDDGNGKVDDVSGWDFVESAAGGPFPAAEDVAIEDNDPNDFAGHGTFVAGVAGAITDNVIGVAGTAPTCRILPLRVAWSANAALSGLVDMSYVAEAVVYGTENGARVLNASFETVTSAALRAALVAAARAGVYVVFAAGNNGGPNDESRVAHVITVAATDANDQVAGFSNLGPFVDVAAPGTGIRSTALVHAGADSIASRQPGYDIEDGTSFSAPMVAGAVALWESRQRSLGAPRLDPVNLALRLWDTADDISALNPGVTGYGGGRLNMEQLLVAPPVSRAFPSASRSIGPPVIVREHSGRRIAWVAANRALVIQSATTGDTLALATLPGGPGRQLAAADLGSGWGPGLFVGTANGRMCGYDLAGRTLAGWPYAAGAFTQFFAGPAIGAGGDGLPEIACGSSDGNLWAWSRDGQLLAGFPVATSALGIAGAIAMADVDGETGDEILAASLDGMLHAVRFDGSEATGFPVAIPGAAPTVSPVVAANRVIVAGGGQAHAFGFGGALLWSASLGGTASQDPALVDFDGDGDREVLIPIAAPNGVAALDPAGAPLTARGWPALLAAPPAGAPVVGPLAPGKAKSTLLLAGASLVAIDDHAQRITGFAKPGGAGAAPSLDDVDGDGRTEIAAGTGPDSLFYLYDAGAGTWADTLSWPTVRGDDARTGRGTAFLPLVDLTPPARIADFAIDSLQADGATLVWTAPGGDGVVGRAARYEIDVTPLAVEAGTFREGNVRTDALPPDPAGTIQRYRLRGLSPNASVFVAVRAVDSTGNAGPSSAVLHVLVPFGGVRRAPALPLAPLVQPSTGVVRWAWRLESGASPAQREIRLYDAQGRWLETLRLGAGESGVAEWNGRDREGHAVPAGIIFARLVSGSFHAQSRVVLLP